MDIPMNILIPALSSIFLAALAHLVSVIMQVRSNKHDFNIKTFDSVSKDLENTKEELREERKAYTTLLEKNTELRGENYKLVTDNDNLRRINEEYAERADSLEEELRILKEKIFQLSAEIEMLKKVNSAVLEKLKIYESSK